MNDTALQAAKRLAFDATLERLRAELIERQARATLRLVMQDAPLGESDQVLNEIERSAVLQFAAGRHR